MGWSMGFVSLGLVIGPLLVSALADGPGYQAAFFTLAAVTGVGGVAFVVLRAPRPATMTAARPVACGCGDQRA